MPPRARGPTSCAPISRVTCTPRLCPHPCMGALTLRALGEETVHPGPFQHRLPTYIFLDQSTINANRRPALRFFPHDRSRAVHLTPSTISLVEPRHTCTPVPALPVGDQIYYVSCHQTSGKDRAPFMPAPVPPRSWFTIYFAWTTLA